MCYEVLRVDGERTLVTGVSSFEKVSDDALDPNRGTYLFGSQFNRKAQFEASQVVAVIKVSDVLEESEE